MWSTWGWYQTPQVKGSVTQDCPPISDVTPSSMSPCYSQLLSYLLQIWGSHDFFPPPWIWLIAWIILRTQGNTFTSLLRDLPKDSDNSQLKRYIGWGLDGSWLQELLFQWSWGAPPSCNMEYLLVDACVHPWNLPQPCTVGICGGFLMKAWANINAFSIPSSLCSKWSGLKIPNL